MTRDRALRLVRKVLAEVFDRVEERWADPCATMLFHRHKVAELRTKVARTRGFWRRLNVARYEWHEWQLERWRRIAGRLRAPARSGAMVCGLDVVQWADQPFREGDA